MKDNKKVFNWSMLPFMLFWIIMLIGIIATFVKAGFPLPMENYPYWVECVLTIAIYLLVLIMLILCYFSSSCLECIKKCLIIKSECDKGDDDN